MINTVRHLQPILAVDIGNSAIKLALIQEQTILTTWRYSLPPQARQAYTKILQQVSSEIQSLYPDTIMEAIVFSSVRPEADRTIFHQAVQNTFSCSENTILQIEHQNCQTLINFSVYAPKELGIDRLVTMIAATTRYPAKPLIILDCGTATTLDIVDSNAVYLGGAIAPGLNTFTDILPQTTSLPALALKKALSSDLSRLGTSTQHSLQMGYSVGYAGAILSLLSWAESYLINTQATQGQLLITGGLANSVVTISHQLASVQQAGTPKCLQKILMEPELMFYGLAHLYQHKVSRGQGVS